VKLSGNEKFSAAWILGATSICIKRTNRPDPARWFGAGERLRYGWMMTASPRPAFPDGFGGRLTFGHPQIQSA
jgi:hypothetical protein